MTKIYLNLNRKILEKTKRKSKDDESEGYLYDNLMLKDEDIHLGDNGEVNINGIMYLNDGTELGFIDISISPNLELSKSMIDFYSNQLDKLKLMLESVD